MWIVDGISNVTLNITTDLMISGVDPSQLLLHLYWSKDDVLDDSDLNAGIIIHFKNQDKIQYTGVP